MLTTNQLWETHIRNLSSSSDKPLVFLQYYYAYTLNYKARTFMSLETNEIYQKLDTCLHLILTNSYNNDVELKEMVRLMEEDVNFFKIDKMIKRLESLISFNGCEDRLEVVKREKKLLRIGDLFLEAAGFNDVKKLERITGAGFDVNFQHPKSKFTALHVALKNNSAEAVDSIMQSKNVDYLIQTKKGYTAFDMAYEFGHCSEITWEILENTLKQAKEKKLDLVDLSVHYHKFKDSFPAR